jgi:molybdopterin-guanine dinucleotide biosynthesis adapter protein
LRVSTLKHAHHAFDIDQPGKDSFAHRSAGATEVLVASSHRWALMHELRGAEEPSLAEHLARLGAVDLVLVEGWKRESHPKLEVYRAVNGRPWLHPYDPCVVGIATDATPPTSSLPCFGIDAIEPIATFVIEAARPWPTAALAPSAQAEPREDRPTQPCATARSPTEAAPTVTCPTLSCPTLTT